MRRAAWWALALHVTLIAFATVALLTIAAGPLPVSMQSGLTARIYVAGWRFSGPTYVVLGALAALLHAAGAYKWKLALTLFTLAALLSLGAELLGTTTGVPFGPYEYTGLLGYRIAGHVPFPIPLSWFVMIYCALAICGRLLPANTDARACVTWALGAGAILTAWDVAMDPAMSSATHHWIWRTGGIYYGMPFTNWVGWFVTGSAIAFAMLVIAPPPAVARRVSPSTLPIALYAANGVMPIAICARHGMWPAAVGGAAAMMIPVGLALRARPVCVSSS